MIFEFGFGQAKTEDLILNIAFSRTEIPVYPNVRVLRAILSGKICLWRVLLLEGRVEKTLIIMEEFLAKSVLGGSPFLFKYLLGT